MNMQVIINQMIQLFLVIGLGYLLRKLGLFDQGLNKKLSTLLLQVTMPAMVLSAVLKADNSVGLSQLSTIFIVSIAAYLLLPLLGLLLNFILRVPKPQKGLYLFMTTFGNVGFMGFPVALAVCGTEGLFYAAILNSVFNILIYTAGVMLMTAGNNSHEGDTAKGQQRMQLKKLLVTPGVLCCAVAVLLFSLQIRLPSLLADTFDTLGGLTSPLAMLVVGANLAGMPLKSTLGNLRLNLYTLVRQFVLPVLMWPVIRLCIGHETLASVLLLMAAMPVANMAALFATEYHADEKLASQAIFVTTLCSLISLPAVVWFCNTVMPF